MFLTLAVFNLLFNNLLLLLNYQYVLTVVVESMISGNNDKLHFAKLYNHSLGFEHITLLQLTFRF